MPCAPPPKKTCLGLWGRILVVWTDITFVARLYDNRRRRRCAGSRVVHHHHQFPPARFRLRDLARQRSPAYESCSLHWDQGAALTKGASEKTQMAGDTAAPGEAH